MELRHLQYFVTVVEEGTVTAAAGRLHVAQPGVSAQLRQLERELGEPLLVRTSRGVTPTAAGRAVLPHARAALAAVRDVRQAVAELTGLVTGRVTIGMAPALATSGLPEQLAEFRVAHSGVEVALTSGTSPELAERVLRGELDLAYLGLAGDVPDGLAAEVVSEQRMVLVVGPDDPLAGVRRVEVARLRDRPLLGMVRGTGLRDVVDAACAAAGFAARVVFEAGDPLLLARLAARGLGAAVLPEGAVAAAGLERAPIDLVPELRSRIELVWRAGGPTSPAGRALVPYLRAGLRNRN